MLLILLKLIKWISLPALLVASPFSQYAARYEFLVDVVISLAAIASVPWAIRSREYFWAAGFVGIAVVFSPLLLVLKIFLLMGLACAVMAAALLATFAAFLRSK